ncbi:macrolide-inactivating glycosyltransferase [Streptomyces mashuensis]|uniref:Macrolide-inactivating glycosyltransferase n=1 Tax=Streptomyces mashuensis TaxID=33904 RepID=A0A919E8K7_9ACTN|nr:macrolide family glycosyltransferase [Streptomyces mashuensis]GHF25430.1 macrolide-inactivating glycosyltransferase [Streptomyces mashuensis]
MTATRTERPAHIAMFNIAAAGHVHPGLEVIRELVRRGHRVTYAVPQEFAEVVAGTGAEVKVYESTLPIADDPDSWGQDLIDHLDMFLDNAVHSLPQLAAAYEDDVPDLVLYDSTAYPARVLAHRWGVPAVLLSPHMVAWDTWEQDIADEIFGPLMTTERGKAYEKRFAGWLADNGLPMDPNEFSRRPDRCLALISRVMQPHADGVDETVNTFTGPCHGDRGHQGTWERPADAEKVLLISLGSAFTKQPAFYRACVAAFGNLPGWHVVLQIGKHVDVAELGEVPPNIEVSSWVPQLAILRQADAFITHAGMGGSQEGLANGVPMVAVPQAADQFANTELLVNLGVARHVPTEEATPELLREAVLSLVADQEVAERLDRIRATMAGEGGTPYAADLVEAELERVR